MADAKCGAKTRSGEPCQSKQMANGRCRMHGGKSTGAPKGSQNALKHGIYGDLISPDEALVADQIMSESGKVESELLVVRLQLRRALIAQQKAESNGGLDVHESISRQGAENVSAHSEKVMRARDYSMIIDRLLARIESLEKTRAALIVFGTPKGDDHSIDREDTFIAPDEPIPDAPIL